MKMKPRTYWGGAAFLAVLAVALPALAEETSIGESVIHLAYALDTFYFLMSGALVMWMAAGFTMLEAGLVRAKNTAEILTKNVGLYSIACVMFMLTGYTVMYPGDIDGSVFASLGKFFSGLVGQTDHTLPDVTASGGEIARVDQALP